MVHTLVSVHVALINIKGKVKFSRKSDMTQGTLRNVVVSCAVFHQRTAGTEYNIILQRRITFTRSHFITKTHVHWNPWKRVSCTNKAPKWQRAYAFSPLICRAWPLFYPWSASEHSWPHSNHFRGAFVASDYLFISMNQH